MQLGAAGVVVAGGGGVVAARVLGAPSPVSPYDPVVAATERKRRTTGNIVRRQLRAAPTTVDLAGRTVRTWAFDGAIPGPEIRAAAGDELRVRLVNELPDPTTVHWHGVSLRNDMDGVPGLTMDPVAAGASFDYSFVAPDPGTYWFHPHVGVQLDTGLQAALIVDDPDERGDYDEEVVLVLDDWTDGLGDSPADNLARLRRDGMPMGGMGEMGMGGMMSTDQPRWGNTGAVVYPLHLVNGRPPEDPHVVRSRPGRRIRFRLINAGGDTAYRFAIGGHRLTVTHTDGFGVRPLEVDTLILGMGERYDVAVTVGDGAFPIVAVPEGKDGAAGMAVLRTASGAAPDRRARPAQLRGALLAYDDLSPAVGAALDGRGPDRQVGLELQMADGGRRWLINGAAYGDHQPLKIRAGERVRLTMRNHSMMFHPMHLHGHTFALAGRGTGIRKDTVIVLPMQAMSVDLQANNPGQWLVHCHNVYHGMLGMMTVVSYVE